MTRLLMTCAVCLALAATAASTAAAPPASSSTTPQARWEQAVDERLGIDVKTRWDSLTGSPRALRKMNVPTQGTDPGERAQRFVNTHRDLLALSDGTSLRVADVTPHAVGHVVKLTASVSGVPIDGRSVTVELTTEGHVRSVRTDLVPVSEAELGVTPKVTADAARAIVEDRFAVSAVGRARQVVLVPAPGFARAAWRVPAALMPLAAHFYVWVDAETGDILKQAPAALDQQAPRLPTREEAAAATPSPETPAVTPPTVAPETGATPDTPAVEVAP